MKKATRLKSFLVLPALFWGCSGKTGAPEGSVPDTVGTRESGTSPFLDLSPQQVASAGIRTVAAGPGRFETTLELSAIVGQNLDTQAHVNPRVPGIVVRIQGHLGQKVAAGDPLCEIDSVELGRAGSDFQKTDKILKNSQAALDQERSLLDRGVAIARKIFEREKDLAQKEITTLRFFYDAEKALQEAQLRRDSRILELQRRIDQDRVDFATARTRLLILGMKPEEYLVPGEKDAGTEGRYLIRAPRGGVIVSRDATEGEFVDSQMTLFDIQDLETVWVQASAYEQDLAKVAVGSQARVLLNALPANPFNGKVDFIDYHVDPDTRSAAVRIVVKNDPLEEWKEPFPIRPGMFGRVEILTGSRKVAVLIPESAIVHEGDRESVFVRLEPGRFEKRIVRTSPGSGGVVEVLGGLDPGEDVVVQGTFALKSFARKGEIGEGD